MLVCAQELVFEFDLYRVLEKASEDLDTACFLGDLSHNNLNTCKALALDAMDFVLSGPTPTTVPWPDDEDHSEDRIGGVGSLFAQHVVRKYEWSSEAMCIPNTPWALGYAIFEMQPAGMGHRFKQTTHKCAIVWYDKKAAFVMPMSFTSFISTSSPWCCLPDTEDMQQQQQLGNGCGMGSNALGRALIHFVAAFGGVE